MLMKFLLLLILVLKITFSFGQSTALLDLSKSSIHTDSRHQTYFKKNKISRDSISYKLTQALSENMSLKLVPLDLREMTVKVKSKRIKRSVFKEDMPPAANKKFFRLLQRKKKKIKYYAYKFNEEQKIPLQEYMRMNSVDTLLVLTRLQIKNDWALNINFRNRSRLQLSYALYDKNLKLIGGYKTSRIFNFQKDMYPAVFWRYIQLKGEAVKTHSGLLKAELAKPKN